ncbi:hypothetical protein Q2T40_16475 [Winogradskyella maritima]|uniref:DUF3784 domain-containing protein n=1 Tax=Winogradskyella maritima TaxID=1517766 RepID=A0ABV8AI23_9FLAO|nr:hypothetical protein [Winogradskyella maritima]
MEKLDEVLSLLALSAGFVTVVFILAKYHYMIKKAMIEKGIDVTQYSKRVSYIDIGCIVFGLGIGFIVSSIFTEMDLTEDTTDLLVLGTISVFAGLSLVIAHYLRKRTS